MRGLIIGIFVFLASIGQIAAAEVNLDGDLSGIYQLEFQREPGKSFDVVLLKTALTIRGTFRPLPQERDAESFEGTYYLVQTGNPILGMHPVGLSYHKDKNNIGHLIWHHFSGVSGSSSQFNAETNSIVRVEGDTLILGGDFYDFKEVGRMKRIRQQ